MSVGSSVHPIRRMIMGWLHQLDGDMSKWPEEQLSLPNLVMTNIAIVYMAQSKVRELFHEKWCFLFP